MSYNSGQHIQVDTAGGIKEKRGGLFFLPWTTLCDKVMLEAVRPVLLMRRQA